MAALASPAWLHPAGTGFGPKWLHLFRQLQHALLSGSQQFTYLLLIIYGNEVAPMFQFSTKTNILVVRICGHERKQFPTVAYNVYLFLTSKHR